MTNVRHEVKAHLFEAAEFGLVSRDDQREAHAEFDCTSRKNHGRITERAARDFKFLGEVCFSRVAKIVDHVDQLGCDKATVCNEAHRNRCV